VTVSFGCVIEPREVRVERVGSVYGLVDVETNVALLTRTSEHDCLVAAHQFGYVVVP
jgi:hypothetical protein